MSIASDVAERLADVAPSDPLAWAHALRLRELACERLTETQRSAWRSALAQEARSQAIEAAWQPPPFDCLPPEMQVDALAGRIFVVSVPSELETEVEL